MTKKHRNDGPTFAHSTIKKPRPLTPSPEQKQAELEQATRDSDKEKRFRQRLKEDPVGLFEEHLGPIEEYLKKKD